MVSSEPLCSPESIKLQNNSSKYFGCFLSAAAKPPPAATSSLILLIKSDIFLFSEPPATISKLCTSGTPAFIMVAICRVNKAMSIGLMALPLPPNKGLGFFLTLLARIPCLISWAFTKAELELLSSP